MRAAATEQGRERLWALGLLGVAAAVSAALVASLTDDWVLNFDDLVFFGHADGYAPSNLLEDHTGHIVALPRLGFAIVLDLWGPGDYAAFSLLLRAFVVASAVLLFLLAARRVRPLAALAPCVVLLFFGSAWTVTLGPGALAMGMGAAAGLAALLVLDDEVDDPGRLLAGAALLCLSLLSFTGGLAFVAAAAVRLALEPGDRLRRLWVPAAPLLLYAAWALWKDPIGGDTAGSPGLSNLTQIFEVAAVSLSATLGGLLGVGYDASASAEVNAWTGAPFAAAALAALVWRAARGPLPPTTWGFLTLLGAYLAMLAVSTSPDREPDDPRHLFFPALALVLIAADLLRDTRIPAGAVALLYAVTAASLAANVAMLVHRDEYLSDYSRTLRAEMAAIELAGEHVPGGFLPLEHDGVMNIAAGDYREAVGRYGSPVSARRDLAAADGQTRAHTIRLIRIADRSTSTR